MHFRMKTRTPPIEITAANFFTRYWLKKDLQLFARSNGLESTGSKAELADRIACFLKTGHGAPKRGRNTIKSRFDWSRSELHPGTVITDNYRNTRQVRNFFIGELGSEFSFNVAFLEWLKNNAGRTLGDAVHQWKKIREEAASGNNKKEPGAQFEYNRYVRDYFADNPGGSLKEAIRCWNYKKKTSGKPAYARADIGKAGGKA
jgi:hypothetical protein